MSLDLYHNTIKELTLLWIMSWDARTTWCCSHFECWSLNDLVSCFYRPPACSRLYPYHIFWTLVRVRQSNVHPNLGIHLRPSVIPQSFLLITLTLWVVWVWLACGRATLLLKNSLSIFHIFILSFICICQSAFISQYVLNRIKLPITMKKNINRNSLSTG